MVVSVLSSSNISTAVRVYNLGDVDIVGELWRKNSLEGGRARKDGRVSTIACIAVTYARGDDELANESD